MKSQAKKQTSTTAQPNEGELNRRASAEPAKQEKQAASAPEAPREGGAAQDVPAPERPDAEEKPKVDPIMERLMRLQADFENYRKRVMRERAEMAQRAAEDLVKDLLPVLDHFELALKSATQHGAPAKVVEGLELVYDEIMGALAKHGLAVVRAEAGAMFDPLQHEAVAHVPSEEIPADAVIEQTRCGYRLGERLLRPAQVVVSSGPPAAES